MKKKLLGGALAALLLAGSCSAAFSDISEPRLAQTAAVLRSLGIMQGDSDTVFAPDRRLTRAEFAKLVVTSFGITDVSAYKSYTVFPDVPSAHWAAGYINAAVKHPDIQKKGILHGYADGTFGPDRTITYGEACTMLLRMLGYTVEDIGPLWPGDYIARAQSEGLTDGVSVMAADSAVARGDAALLLLHTLETAGKEGDKRITALTSSADSAGAILLATSQTDSDLRKNQARFYTGEDEPVVKKTEGVLDRSLIGVRGTLYYSRTSPGTVLTVLPDHGGWEEQYTVRRAGRDGIEVDGQSRAIRPERGALLYARGAVGKYSETWFDLQPGDQITLHYGEDGALELIRAGTKDASKNSFVYGTKDAASIPEGYAIEKNGVETERSRLKPYDVVSLDAEGRRAVVSDAKVTGYYNAASPAFKNPEKITFLGREYTVSERAAGYFSGFEAGDRITLLLDARGAVAAAYPASSVRADMAGVFTDLVDGEAQVTLFNGATVRGKLQSEQDKQSFGRAVTVSQTSKGALSITARPLSGAPGGDWAVGAGTLGAKKVVPAVRVFEQVAPDAPLCETTLSKLGLDTVPRGHIRTTVSDSAGQVIAVVLDDVTGDAWNYGYGAVSVTGGDDETQESITVRLRHYDYTVGAPAELTYQASRRPEGGMGLIGLPKHAEKNPARQTLAAIRLEQVGTVALEDFDGADGVRTKKGYYPISDEVQVYLTASRRFVTLREARADYSRFTLYAERSPEQGGKIRVITVQ